MVNCLTEGLALGSCSTAERSAVHYALGSPMQQSASVSRGIRDRNCHSADKPPFNNISIIQKSGAKFFHNQCGNAVKCIFLKPTFPHLSLQAWKLAEGRVLISGDIANSNGLWILLAQWFIMMRDEVTTMHHSYSRATNTKPSMVYLNVTSFFPQSVFLFILFL